MRTFHRDRSFVANIPPNKTRPIVESFGIGSIVDV